MFFKKFNCTFIYFYIIIFQRIVNFIKGLIFPRPDKWTLAPKNPMKKIYTAAHKYKKIHICQFNFIIILANRETMIKISPYNYLAKMGRMHSSGKGISRRCLPFRKAPPSWVQISASDLTEQIVKLAKKGTSPSQIGVILRD